MKPDESMPSCLMGLFLLAAAFMRITLLALLIQWLHENGAGEWIAAAARGQHNDATFSDAPVSVAILAALIYGLLHVTSLSILKKDRWK